MRSNAGVILNIARAVWDSSTLVVAAVSRSLGQEAP